MHLHVDFGFLKVALSIQVESSSQETGDGQRLSDLDSLSALGHFEKWHLTERSITLVLGPVLSLESKVLIALAGSGEDESGDLSSRSQVEVYKFILGHFSDNLIS